MVSRSEVLAKLAVGTTFDSFEEVKQLKEQLRTICYFPLSIGNARTVQAHNKLIQRKRIDEKFQYQSVQVQCVHFGKHRNRAKGIRNLKCST